MKKINIVLIPTWEKLPNTDISDHNAGTIKELEVSIQAEIEAQENECMLSVNEVTIFKPFTRTKKEFVITDETGNIPYRLESVQEGHIKAKRYIAERSTGGMVSISYRLLLEPAGRNPVFDLGFEEGGMTGSGMTFMPSFKEGTYEYTVNWNLEQLPEGSRGAWSFGEGRITRSGNESLLQTTFYSAGQLDCVKMGRFGYYWMKNETILPLAVLAAQIFAYESRFFKDEGEAYNIFSRHTEAAEQRAGGTALTRSYMYIYKDNAQLDPSWIKFLFAHEIVHNWITMKNEPFGITTWYIEGMAEFYSVLLPWRMGIITRDELLLELNKRAVQYYENPRITKTDMEAGSSLMADSEMTRIPYGRGFFYLLHADAMIRKASDNKNKLDDVMLAILEAGKETLEIGNETWIREYGAYVGEETARREHESISSGHDVIPDTACFEGEISVEKAAGKQRETKMDCVLWRFV